MYHYQQKYSTVEFKRGLFLQCKCRGWSGGQRRGVDTTCGSCLNIKHFVLCGCSNWSVSHQVLGLPPSLCCVCSTLTSPTGLDFTVHWAPHNRAEAPWTLGQANSLWCSAQVQVTPDPWSGLMTPSFPLTLRSFKLVKVSVIVISGYGSVIFEILLYLQSIGSWKRNCFQCVCACLCVW